MINIKFQTFFTARSFFIRDQLDFARLTRIMNKWNSTTALNRLEIWEWTFIVKRSMEYPMINKPI